MSNEYVETERLIEEFQDVARQLEDILKDLEWRKPDVEAEEAKLRELLELEKKGGCHDVATQAIVVRVLRGVLNDKIAEADRLEKRMLELEAQIKVRMEPEPEEKKRGKRGKAIR